MNGRQTTSHGLLIDLDGVIYQGGKTIDGALDALAWIRQRSIPHLFVTNTTSRSRASLLEKFDAYGFALGIDELMTPIVAAIQYLQHQRMRRIAVFVTPGAAREFTEFDIVEAQSQAVVDAVVIGDLGTGWNYQRLNYAFRLLMQDPRPRLIALGMTRYWRGKDGLLLDVAPFVSALETAANCKASVLGKPAAVFFETALQRLDISAGRCFMIGDDIDADIGGAQNCGIRGIQVRSGKFRESDLQGTTLPFAVLDSIAELPRWWRQTVDKHA